MKIIHCADVHLGSALSSLPKDVAAQRKIDVQTNFARMVEYAKSEKISLILLSGDVFDTPNPPKKYLNFFYEVIQSSPEIDFLYLRGNHDLAREPEEHTNLKIFSDTWTSYTYGNTVISGIEINSGNSESYYSTLSLDPSKKNIVMLHGQIGSDINLTKLRDKNIDYLALGHIHSYSSGEIDRRGRYAYCGCLEGRGFDETGEKGFVILDTDGVGISHEFHPFSLKIIEEHRVDVSGVTGAYDASSRVNNTVNLKENGIYRIILTGELSKNIPELDTTVYSLINRFCGHLSVKDETTLKINYADYENDLSLRGEFIRTVLASTEYTEEEKSVIINYGLKALSGEKPE